MLGTTIDHVVVHAFPGPGHYGRSNGGNAGAEDEGADDGRDNRSEKESYGEMIRANDEERHAEDEGTDQSFFTKDLCEKDSGTNLGTTCDEIGRCENGS